MPESPVYDPATDLPLYTGTGGSEAPAETADGQPCTCCGNSVRPRICGADATCGKFCFPDKKDFSQSECCDCPCPGRTGLPPGYEWTIGPVSLRGGRQPAEDTPSNIDFYTVSGGSGLVFDECNTSHTVSVLSEREVRNPDGSLNHIDSSTGTWTISAALFIECILCPQGSRTRALRIQASVDIGGGPNGLGAHYPRYSLNDLDHTIAETKESCCLPGGASLLPDIATDENLPSDTTNFIASGGVVEWKPKCVDCDDIPLQTNTGAPNSICASDLNYYIEFWDGANWIPETGTLNKGGCKWSGGSGLQINIATTALNGSSCSDNCDCNKCKANGAADCAGCKTEWKLTINRVLATYSEFMGAGACPPTGFRGLDGTNFRNFTLTFGTTCPP